MESSRYPAYYKYVILVVCSVFLAMVYVTLSTWGVCSPIFQEKFQLSSALAMAGSATLMAGYAIGSFLEGRMMASIGWRKTFLFAMVMFLVPIFLIPQMTNYTVILVLRFMQGFGLVVTITNSMVCGWFPANQRGLASGILLGFIALGSAVGSMLPGVITPKFGWQANVYILGAAVVVGTVLFLLLVKDPPALDEGGDGAEEKVIVKLKPGRSVYSHPIMIMLGFAMFCVFFNVYGMYSFLSTYLYDMGYATAQVGSIGFWNGLIGLISTPFGGWIGDALIKRGMPTIRARAYSMGVVAFLIGAIGCILMPSMAPVSLTMAVIPAMLAGWGCPAANGPICSLPSDVFGAKIGGGAVGFILLVAGAGGVIAPIAVPAIASAFGWNVGWYVTGAAALIGLGVCLFTPTLAERAEKNWVSM